jgi:hypothetical protein
MLEVKCDFCHNAPAIARHRCDPRSQEADVPWFQEWWNACKTCHQIVLEGNAHALATVAMDADPRYIIHVEERGHAMALEAHEAFWRADAGEWEQFGFE